MKTVVSFFTLIVVAATGPIDNGGLRYDLMELVDLLPDKKISRLIDEYYDNDNKMHQVFNYLKDYTNYQTALEEIAEIPDIMELGNWIQSKLYREDYEIIRESDQEVDHELIKRSADNEIYIINAVPMPNGSRGGWDQFYKDLCALWPKGRFNKWFTKKIRDGREIGELYSKVRGMRPVYKKVLQLESVQKVTRDLVELGVDFHTINQLIYNFFEW